MQRMTKEGEASPTFVCTYDGMHNHPPFYSQGSSASSGSSRAIGAAHRPQQERHSRLLPPCSRRSLARLPLTPELLSFTTATRPPCTAAAPNQDHCQKRLGACAATGKRRAAGQPAARRGKADEPAARGRRGKGPGLESRTLLVRANEAKEALHPVQGPCQKHHCCALRRNPGRAPH